MLRDGHAQIGAAVAPVHPHLPTAAVTPLRPLQKRPSCSEADSLNIRSGREYQDRYMLSTHSTGREHLGIGRMLASGKHVDLIHHLCYVRAKGAEHQSEVPLLHPTQHLPLSRWSYVHIGDQSQQEEDEGTHTSTLLRYASCSSIWRHRAPSQDALGQCEVSAVLFRSAGLQCIMAVTCF